VLLKKQINHSLGQKQNGLFFIAYVEGYVYIKKSKGGNTLRLFPFSLLNIQHILLKNKRT